MSAEDVPVCSVAEDVITRVKKMKMSKEKTINALLLKVDFNTKPEEIVVDEEFQDTDIEEIQNEIPTHMPSYVVLSYIYKHDDGRVSYPFCFIFITPQGCKPDISMMYAGSKLNLVRVTEMTKVFEIRSADEFTEEWLLKKLKFF